MQRDRCDTTRKLVTKMENIRKMSTDMSPQRIVIFIFYAIALAMGVATIVLPILGQTVDQSLVGIAVFCLAVAGMNTVTEKS
jgi:hypothetical protein